MTFLWRHVIMETIYKWMRHNGDFFYSIIVSNVICNFNWSWQLHLFHTRLFKWHYFPEQTDVSTGPLARPFAHSLAPLSHFFARGKVNDQHWDIRLFWTTVCEGLMNTVTRGRCFWWWKCKEWILFLFLFSSGVRKARETICILSSIS